MGDNPEHLSPEPNRTTIKTSCTDHSLFELDSRSLHAVFEDHTKRISEEVLVPAHKRYKSGERVRSVSRGCQDIRLEHRIIPKWCYKYQPVELYAEGFVDSILQDSIKTHAQKLPKAHVDGFDVDISIGGISVENIGIADGHSEPIHSDSIGTYIFVIEWPTISEFTVDMGRDRIEQFLSFWKVKEAWKYCVLFLRSESDHICDIHTYQAIFSIPTKQYPIPQATASVFFTMEVSRVRPKHCLVDVMHYSFKSIAN